MWIYVSYVWQNAIEERGHYLVLEVAASGGTVVVMATVETAAFEIVVGAEEVLGGAY